MIATHKLHVSSDRLTQARSWLEAHTDELARMSYEARIVAAVGLLICDERGHIPREALESAMADSRAVSAANRLISGVNL